jgi:cytochrome c553
MKRFSVLLAALALPLSASAAQAPGPDWAFMTPDPNAPAPAAANAPAPAAPQPGAPAIVVSGKGAAVPACSSCHGASGVGGPHSANIRGQNADYIVRQMMDFKSGTRRSPLATHGPIAGALTDAEIAAAAKYYDGLSPMRSARIVEAANAPKTMIGRNNQRTKLPGNATEPLGKRIVEFAEASPQAPFVAYVPPGSLAAGKTITGGGKVEECASCHGDGLKGSEDLPRLAGRSPTYIARQLYQFKNGLRKGGYADVMKDIASGLNDDDIIAAAAYVGSLDP